MGLPVARSVDAYSQYSRDDEDFFVDDDDLSPVDYTTRRQTSVHTASLRRQADNDDDELTPVDYDVRRQTVSSAVLRQTESHVISSKNTEGEDNFIDFGNVELTHNTSESQEPNNFRPRVQTEVRSAEIHRSATVSEATRYDVVDFGNVRATHEEDERNSERPRLQTVVHTATIQKHPNVTVEKVGHDLVIDEATTTGDISVDTSAVDGDADVRPVRHRPRALSEGAKTKKRKSKRDKKEKKKDEDDYRTPITRRRTISIGKKKSKKESVVGSMSKY